MKQHQAAFQNLITGTITAMGGRAPDTAALAIWAMALENFKFEDVQEAIVNWTSNESTWPRPADIAKAIKGKHARAAEQAEASHRVAYDMERASHPDAPPEVKEQLEKISRAANGTNHSQSDYIYRAKRIREARAKGWSTVDGITLLPIHDYWADRVLGVN